jgi:hypothetical protein
METITRHLTTCIDENKVENQQNQQKQQLPLGNVD